jgi:hypothetical protein
LSHPARVMIRGARAGGLGQPLWNPAGGGPGGGAPVGQRTSPTRVRLFMVDGDTLGDPPAVPPRAPGGPARHITLVGLAVRKEYFSPPGTAQPFLARPRSQDEMWAAAARVPADMLAVDGGPDAWTASLEASLSGFPWVDARKAYFFKVRGKEHDWTVSDGALLDSAGRPEVRGLFLFFISDGRYSVTPPGFGVESGDAPPPVNAAAWSGTADPVARAVAVVRATQIAPRLDGIEKILRNYAGSAIEANRKYYMGWHYNDLLAMRPPDVPRLAAFWRQLYAAVWDVGIPSSAFPAMVDRYEQVDRVFNRIPWPSVFKDGPPERDAFAQCARGIPFWRGADGVPRSVINPRFFLDGGGYFPRPDAEIEIDMAVAYAMNFEAIILCVQDEVLKKRRRLERKIRAMKKNATLMRVMMALVVPGVGTITAITGELIERFVAKDNPELAKLIEIGVSVVISLLVPGAGVATTAAGQVGEQVIKQGLALMQAELAKRAAAEGREAVARFSTVEEYLREVAGAGSIDRDASVARWIVWVIETLNAAVFLDALAGRQGVALDALNHILAPLKEEAAGPDAPEGEAPAQAAPPEAGQPAPGAPAPPAPGTEAAAPDGTPTWVKAAVGVGLPAAASAAVALL